MKLQILLVLVLLGARGAAVKLITNIVSHINIINLRHKNKYLIENLIK